MDTGLIISLAGLGVAGFSSLLGIWLERDMDKPKKIAAALSILIILATGVGMVQALLDQESQQKMEGDLARMLATLDKIASSSDVAIPELDALIKSETAAQARTNPDVVKKLAQRVTDEGGDAAAMLGSYMSASEVQEFGRKGGLKIKPPAVAVVAVGKDAEKPRDRVRPTLQDVASGKAPMPGAAPKTAAPPPPPPEPATQAAAPPTQAPPVVAAFRKPKGLMAKPAAAIPKPAEMLKSPGKAMADFKAAPADTGKAASEEAKMQADAAKAKAAEAQKKAAADAQKKADEAKAAAKKKADDAAAAAKKKAADAKKKLTGGLF